MHTEQERIKRDVVEQLYWDQRVDSSTIHVDVSGKQVRLTGTVPSFFARMAAEHDAASVEGVLLVVNELTVSFHRVVSVPSDEGIEAHIVDKLTWNPNFDSSTITVSVLDGTVIISGTVDAYWKKVRIEELAFETAGVMEVENRLQVKPRYAVADRDLLKAIRRALLRTFGLREDTVKVSVTDGVVLLTGFASDRYACMAVENVVRHTLGVVDIKNELEMRQS